MEVVARLERGTYGFSLAREILISAWAEVVLTDGRVVSTHEGSAALDWHVERIDGAAFTLRLRFTNTSDAPVRIEQLLPLVSENGFRGLSREKLLTTDLGWQSWSRAHMARPYTPNAATAPPPIRTPILPHRQADGETIGWMAVLQASAGPACLVAFLGGRDQTGVIDILARSDGHALRATAETEGVSIQPGASVHSEPLLLAFGDVTALTARYANIVAERMGARVPTHTPSGWCSWYQFGTDVTEADVRRNLDALIGLREQLPIDLIQLDDGYQRAVGDWLDIRETFPTGIASLMGDIRAAGFTPGLWMAPFLVSARSALYEQHPDWVVRVPDTDEPLVAIRNWDADNYALDTTQPDALDWLADVLHTVCEVWGVDYLKLDFLYAAALRGRRLHPNVTGAQAYTRGLRLIRRVAGARFLLGCGAPLVSSVGLVDGMRIGSDVTPFWSAPEAVNGGVGPSTFNAVRATLTRACVHRLWWLNDPDCVLARTATQLSDVELRAWASVVGLSGGMLVLGDDFSQLDSTRLALIARLFPPSDLRPEALPPLVDDAPQRVRLDVHRGWANWTIAGIANWTDAPRDAVYDPAEWDAAPSAYYLVDLWSGEAVGPTSGPTDLGTLAAHELRLLSVHTAGDRPTAIGSTGHVLGEAMDVLDETWSDRTLRVALASDRPHTGVLLVAVPPGWRHIPDVSGRASWAAGERVLRVPFGTTEPREIRLRFQPVTA